MGQRSFWTYSLKMILGTKCHTIRIYIWRWKWSWASCTWGSGTLMLTDWSVKILKKRKEKVSTGNSLSASRCTCTTDPWRLFDFTNELTNSGHFIIAVILNHPRRRSVGIWRLYPVEDPSEREGSARFITQHKPPLPSRPQLRFTQKHIGYSNQRVGCRGKACQEEASRRHHRWGRGAHVGTGNTRKCNATAVGCLTCVD